MKDDRLVRLPQAYRYLSDTTPVRYNRLIELLGSAGEFFCEMLQYYRVAALMWCAVQDLALRARFPGEGPGQRRNSAYYMYDRGVPLALRLLIFAVSFRKLQTHRKTGHEFAGKTLQTQNISHSRSLGRLLAPSTLYCPLTVCCRRCCCSRRRCGVVLGSVHTPSVLYEARGGVREGSTRMRRDSQQRQVPGGRGVVGVSRCCVVFFVLLQTGAGGGGGESTNSPPGVLHSNELVIRDPREYTPISICGPHCSVDPPTSPPPVLCLRPSPFTSLCPKQRLVRNNAARFQPVVRNFEQEKGEGGRREEPGCVCQRCVRGVDEKLYNSSAGSPGGCRLHPSVPSVLCIATGQGAHVFSGSSSYQGASVATQHRRSRSQWRITAHHCVQAP